MLEKKVVLFKEVEHIYIEDNLTYILEAKNRNCNVIFHLNKNVNHYQCVILENNKFNRFIYVEENIENLKETLIVKSNCKINDFIVSEKNTDNKIVFEAEVNSQSELYSNLIIKSTNKSAKSIDVNVSLKEKAKSDIFVLGFFYDNAEANLKAITNISETAVKSHTNQHFNIYIFSERASIKCLPILNIKNNDVFAKHAYSTNKLNPTQKAYLLSRGLDENSITKLMTEAALIKFLKKIENNALKDEIKTKFNFINWNI